MLTCKEMKTLILPKVNGNEYAATLGAELVIDYFLDKAVTKDEVRDFIINRLVVQTIEDTLKDFPALKPIVEKEIAKEKDSAEHINVAWEVMRDEIGRAIIGDKDGVGYIARLK